MIWCAQNKRILLSWHSLWAENNIMGLWGFFISKRQGPFVIFAGVLYRGHDIDSCCVDAAVSQNISQCLGRCLSHTIKVRQTACEDCGETPCCFSPAASQRDFICAQILLRSNGFPFLVIKLLQNGCRFLCVIQSIFLLLRSILSGFCFYS